jgi:hypothetical protein
VYSENGRKKSRDNLGKDDSTCGFVNLIPTWK